jgi:hypothetical protein
LTSTVAWANHVEKLAAADDQYRGFTVEDSGVRINAINMIPKPDRAWWWYRVPADGPVAVFLSRYDAEGNYVGQSEGDESKLITPRWPCRCRANTDSENEGEPRSGRPDPNTD